MTSDHKKEKNKDIYAQAGVNIDLGNQFVTNIKKKVNSTSRIGSMGGIGGFGGLFDLKATKYQDPILVSSTDGVGTKLMIAQELNQHKTIGIDLVAMCVNDLIVQGAEPLFFLDYFATGKLELGIAEDVIEGIVEGCKQSGCALIGGETAEMPGMYDNNHYDLAGFAVGVVERNKILPSNDIVAGDVILGLKSSGVHSNGYSLVRKIIKDSGLSLNDKAPFNNNITIGEVALTPTKIYVKSCMEAIKTGKVKAMAHITGGGITENLPRVLSEDIGARINTKSWEMHDIFKWMVKTANINQNDLYKTFNCGLGMTIIVDSKSVSEIKKILSSAGEEVFEIGLITKLSHQKVQVEYV